jgi:hypothetical protein
LHIYSVRYIFNPYNTFAYRFKLYFTILKK